VTIPDFETLMRPIMAFLEDGQTRSNKEVVVAMSEQFGLTADERAQLLPSGKLRMIDNRVAWAVTHLSAAGLLTRPARAHVQMTDAGRDVLAQNPERVDFRVLRAFPSFVEFRNRTRAAKPAATAPAVSEVEEQVSPQDLVAQAEAENKAAVEGELLQRAFTLDPTGFERLVLRLLSAMGYGRDGSLQHSGKSGDAGIDGIISQDPLGLDRIYLQAKRYAPDQPVGRPTIQAFVGALMGAQGDRGVFIATSSFTKGASEEAERVNARIELIDGARLATLMLRHGVGVQPETTVVLHEIDEDFFESL
jgi:restriction system protein